MHTPAFSLPSRTSPVARTALRLSSASKFSLLIASGCGQNKHHESCDGQRRRILKITRHEGDKGGLSVRQKETVSLTESQNSFAPVRDSHAAHRAWMARVRPPQPQIGATPMQNLIQLGTSKTDTTVPERGTTVTHQECLPLVFSLSWSARLRREN